VVGFLLLLLGGFISGNGWLSAVEAFTKPAVTESAKRYRVVAAVVLMGGAAFLVMAGLLSPFDNEVSNFCGYTGLFCLEICAICGTRYMFVNKLATDNLEPPEYSN
jgi:hypothetical protein